MAKRRTNQLKKVTKRKLFEKAITVLQDVLKLDKWKIIVKFTPRMRNAADCDPSPEYKEALIRVKTGELKRITPREVIDLAAHELIHCVVWPMASLSVDLSRGQEDNLERQRQTEEATVTKFTQIIVPLVENLVNEALLADEYEPIDFSTTPLEVRHSND